MKKLLLISMVFGAMPLAMMAQDDDLYFVPKKKSAEKVQDNYGMPKNTYYCGSDRSIDDYNRRLQSSYQVIDGDSTKSDIIDFSSEKGVYPDSLNEDYKLTKQMARFDDYDLSDNVAFWTGYNLGRNDWGWHSTWYYSRYGWYDPWYSPWYYGSWYYGWYDPWYYGYYGWYDPWYYSYYGWGYPYYWAGGYPHYHGGGGGVGYAHIGTGTIRRDGSTHGYHGGAVAGNSSRRNSLSERASAMGGSSANRSNNSVRSNSGNFSGYRGNTNNSNSGSFSGSRSNSSSRSSGSFGGSRSGGGGFSGGGGSRGGGGGGGSRLGGRR